MATTGFDDCHTARFVTSTVVPSELSAWAKSCSFSPGATAVAAFPAVPTRTAVTVTAGVVVTGVVVCVGDVGAGIGLLPLQPERSNTPTAHRASRR